MTGDADLSRIGELFADRARSRILMALDAGRELSAGLLADEAEEPLDGQRPPQALTRAADRRPTHGRHRIPCGRTAVRS